MELALGLIFLQANSCVLTAVLKQEHILCGKIFHMQYYFVWALPTPTPSNSYYHVPLLKSMFAVTLFGGAKYSDVAEA